MIHSEPLTVQLGNEYLEDFRIFARQVGCNVLCEDRLWVVLRDYSPHAWNDVVSDLRLGNITRTWFSKR